MLIFSQLEKLTEIVCIQKHHKLALKFWEMCNCNNLKIGFEISFSLLAMLVAMEFK